MSAHRQEKEKHYWGILIALLRHLTLLYRSLNKSAHGVGREITSAAGLCMPAREFTEGIHMSLK